MFVTPVRHANIAEEIYATCSYAVMASDTSHFLMVNPSPRPVKVHHGNLVGMYEPLIPNMPYSFFGTTSTSILQPTLQPATLTTTETTMPWTSIKTPYVDLAGTRYMNNLTLNKGDALCNGAPDIIKFTLGLNDPNLTWHDGLNVPIDSFGLENEFHEKGPLHKDKSIRDSEGRKSQTEETPKQLRGREGEDEGNEESGERKDGESDEVKTVETGDEPEKIKWDNLPRSE